MLKEAADAGPPTAEHQADQDHAEAPHALNAEDPNENTGSKSYFQEIVKNARAKMDAENGQDDPSNDGGTNSEGDKVDLSQYKEFQKQYNQNQTFLKKRHQINEEQEEEPRKQQKTSADSGRIGNQAYEKDVDTWSAPQGQVGDGQTSLNRKFGYWYNDHVF